MQYADKLEASGKCLPELLNLSTGDLYSQFGMKRGHLARFMDRTNECTMDPSPTSLALPARHKTTTPSRNTSSIYKPELMSINSRKLNSMVRATHTNNSVAYDVTIEQSLASFKMKDGQVFKGIVAAMPEEPRGCGCVQSPPVVDDVAPYSVIDSITVQRLTPEYKIGMERLVTTKTPPMKASDLWRNKPAVLLCIRRPGCVKAFILNQQSLEMCINDLLFAMENY